MQKAIALVMVLVLGLACNGNARGDGASRAPAANARKSQPAVITEPGGPYRITRQEPITDIPSPNSLFGKRLPVDVMRHLAAHDVDIAVDSLKACSPGSCTDLLIFAHSGSRNSINDIPQYYGNAGDPAYVITRGPTPKEILHQALGKAFHAPDRAMTNGADSEDFFMVWDQVQDKYFTFYRYVGSKGSAYAFPHCSSTDLERPCDIGISPSDSMVSDRDDPQGYGVSLGNPWASNGIFPPIGLIRVQELIQGHIYHPIYLNTLCQQTSPRNPKAAATVFPILVDWGAMPCSRMPRASNVDEAPAAGALVFLDYNDEQLKLLRRYMPAWQYPIVEAMSHYGGYVGDTGNPLHPARLESDDAYALAGVENPLWDWLANQPGLNRGCGPRGQCNLEWSDFALGKGPCPSAGLCDITRHLHIADPCVPAGMAGVSSPAPCVGAVQVSVIGPGTITSHPAGINCDRSDQCNLAASNGTKVELSAVPDSGHKFEGWAGSCSGEKACRLKLDGKQGLKILTARFH
jgi:hypothetical protein